MEATHATATLDRAGLVKALGVVSAATPQHTYKPILRNAKLNVSVSGGNGASLTATNLEFAVSCGIAAEDVQAPGDLLLPVKDVSTVLADDPSEKVGLGGMDNGTRVQTQRGDFRFPTEPPAEFPVTGHFETSWRCTFPATVIRTMFHRVAAPCKEIASTSYTMGCVALRSPKKTQIIAAGSDGGLLAMQNLNVDDPEGTWPENDVLIPAETARRLSRILPTNGGETLSTLSIGENWASVSTCDLRADFLLRHGRFFPFPSTEFAEPAKFDIPVAVLRSAVKQISPMARLVEGRTGKYGITMEVRSGTLKISDSEGSVVELPIPEGTKSVSVRLSHDRILTALRPLDPSETIHVQLQSAEGQYGGLIFHTDDEYYRCILMGLGKPGETQ